MFDVVAIGDTMIDFTPVYNPDANGPVYEANVGGTIANFAASCSKMGMSAHVVSRLGFDDFAKQCEKSLRQSGVDTSSLSYDQTAFTTLSFVSLQAGERSFVFSRRFAADINLEPTHFDWEKVLNTRILHVSGMSFTDEPCRSTTFALMKEAKKRGITVTLDLNYREQLWQNEADFIQVMRSVIEWVTVAKGSIEEVELLTGQADYVRAAEEIQGLGPDLVVISAGAKGAYYKTKTRSGRINTYDTKRVDTTGAGDCFMGALVYSFIQNSLQGYAILERIEDSIDFANASGAVSISTRGGVASAPSVEAIKACQTKEKRLVLSW